MAVRAPAHPKHGLGASISIGDVRRWAEERYGAGFFAQRIWDDAAKARASAREGPFSQICPHFFVSNQAATASLVPGQVALVVSLGSRCAVVPSGTQVHHDGASDEDGASARPVWDAVIPSMRAAMERGEDVLVHCRAGMRRSPALALAFLLSLNTHTRTAPPKAPDTEAQLGEWQPTMDVSGALPANATGLTLRDCCRLVAAARPQMRTNPAHARELIAMEIEILGLASVRFDERAKRLVELP
jgi:hypothetical protein